MIDCNLSNASAQGPTAAVVAVDTCGAANASNFARFGASPTVAFGGTFFCGQERVKGEIENTEWGSDYCSLADQDLYSGWGARRSEWQFGLGIQREIIPRLSAEVTYNQRWYQNLQVTDTLGQGCDLYTANREQCVANMFNFQAPTMLDNDNQQRAQWSFYRVQAPVDDRLPNGGGYFVTGLNTRGTFTPLPTGQSVATYQNYTSGWKGIDTNFVLRARGGLRLNGGTSTGGSFTDDCNIMANGPDIRMREGSEPACRLNAPWQTNIRGSASYTIPWVDVLASAVFQSRPGPSIGATVTYRINNSGDPNQPQIQWEQGSEWRATNTTTCTQTTNTGAPHPMAVGCFMESTTATVGVNVLDTGDLYGSRYNLFDLKLAKNIRFARRRVNIGVDIYNLFNSDAVVGYNGNYNPQTWTDDSGTYFNNVWRSATSLIQPRFARFSVQLDF